MKLYIFKFLFIATSLLTTISCQKKDTHVRESTNEISNRMNTFCLDMMKEVSSTTPGNILFSPFSIYTAFFMLHLGAKNNTRKEIDAALRWNPRGKEDQMKELYNDVFAANKGSSCLALANKEWVDESVKPIKSYNNILRKIFQTETGIERFSENSEKSRLNINKWVSEQTDGHIKDLFPSASIDSNTRLVLANAIYFKGKWASKFDVENTHQGKFYLANGKTVKVSYMWKNDKLSSIFDSERNVHVLEIPYENGQFSIIFIMPKNSQINQVPDLNNIEVLNEWINQLSMKKSAHNIDVTIPKFKLDQRLDLKDIFQKMGVRDLFTPEKADLSGITGQKNLYCGTAVHKSFINVDEEGTTAAGATGAGMLNMSMPPHITIDRPFVFYIVKKPSNIIIFAGKVMNPTVD